MEIKSPISKKYGEFLNELLKTAKPYKDISFQIFYDLFKIHESHWKFKIRFNRRKAASISDIFQDLIAYYLKIFLSEHQYEIICEYTKSKKRPDILVKKNGKNKAIIEVKTNIGWKRGLVKEQYKKDLEDLSKTFNVPREKTFYILETATNVGAEFASEFRKPNNKFANDIFPLFHNNTNPYYIKNSCKNKIDRKKQYIKFSDEEIYNIYDKSRLTPFEKILKKIKN